MSKTVEDFFFKARQVYHDHGEGMDALDMLAPDLAELAMQPDLFSLDNYPAVSDPAAQFTQYMIHADPGINHYLVLFDCRAGHIIPPHSHPNYVILAQITGSQTHTMYEGDETTYELTETGTVDLTPGDTLCMTTTDVHSVVIGDQPVRYLSMNGPRESYAPAKFWTFPYVQRQYRQQRERLPITHDLCPIVDVHYNSWHKTNPGFPMWIIRTLDQVYFVGSVESTVPWATFAAPHGRVRATLRSENVRLVIDEHNCAHISASDVSPPAPTDVTAS